MAMLDSCHHSTMCGDACDTLYFHRLLMMDLQQLGLNIDTTVHTSSRGQGKSRPRVREDCSDVMPQFVVY